MKSTDSLFLSTTSRLAQLLASRFNVPVVLHDGTSCTDGEKLYLDMRQGSYEGDLKLYYDGVVDHEIAHIKFSQFTNPLANNQLKNQEARNVFGTKYESYAQHLEDLRVNRLMSAKFIGCAENIKFTEEVCLMEHAKNFDMSKKLFKYRKNQRFILAVRSLLYPEFFEQFFSKDKFVLRALKIYKAKGFDRKLALASTTEETILLSKQIYDLINNLEDEPEYKDMDKEEKKSKKEKREQPKKEKEDEDDDEDTKPSETPSPDQDEEPEEDEDEESDDETLKPSKKEDEEDEDEEGDDDEDEEGDGDGEESSDEDDEEDEDEEDKSDRKTSRNDEEDDDEEEDDEEEEEEEEEDEDEIENEGWDRENDFDNDEEGDEDSEETEDGESENEEDYKDMDKEESAERDRRRDEDKVTINTNELFDAPEELKRLDKIFDLAHMKPNHAIKAIKGRTHNRFDFGSSRLDKLAGDKSERRKNYEAWLKEYSTGTRDNVAKITNAFIQNLFAKSLVYEYESAADGKLNLRELAREAFIPDYESRFPFLKTTENQTRRVAVTVLIDMSGSMAGKRIQDAQRIAIIMAEAFKRVNVPFEVLGHHVLSFFDSGKRGSYRGYGRTEATDLIVFKDFQNQDLTWLGLIGEGATGSNADGAAMEMAAQRLYPRQEERRILFLISDGEPTGYHSEQAGENHMRFVADQCKKNNMEFHCIGIEHDVIRIFGKERAFEIADGKSLASNLVSCLIKTINQ